MNTKVRGVVDVVVSVFEGAENAVVAPGPPGWRESPVTNGGTELAAGKAEGNGKARVGGTTGEGGAG